MTRVEELGVVLEQMILVLFNLKAWRDPPSPAIPIFFFYNSMLASFHVI